MTDEIKLHRDAARAARAAALLADDELVEAWNAIERELIEAMIATAPTESAARDKFHQAIHINRKHRALLQNVITNGKLAQNELNALADRARRGRPPKAA